MTRTPFRLTSGTVLLALLIAAVILGLLGGGALLFAMLGFYDIAAVHQHTAPVYWLLETTKRASVVQHARDIAAPDLAGEARIDRGLALYRQNCVTCHGAPGIAPAEFALGLTPSPPPLMQVAREWSPEEMYWAIRNGIKMTAMPAWEYRLDDSALWDIVAFLRVLPTLSPAEYCARTQEPACTPAAQARRTTAAASRDPADAGRGRIALRQYGCDTCHRIPGVVGPQARVGPPLDDVATGFYIAGVLRNTPDNLRLWIRFPQTVKPLSGMPDLGVSDKDARDIAAYLYSLR
jgi:mono/diheme cytochrome c family protein